MTNEEKDKILWKQAEINGERVMKESALNLKGCGCPLCDAGHPRTEVSVEQTPEMAKKDVRVLHRNKEQPPLDVGQEPTEMVIDEFAKLSLETVDNLQFLTHKANEKLSACEFELVDTSAPAPTQGLKEIKSKADVTKKTAQGLTTLATVAAIGEGFAASTSLDESRSGFNLFKSIMQNTHKSTKKKKNGNKVNKAKKKAAKVARKNNRGR